MSDLLICLHHGPSIVSKLIRWQTRSHWNHASFLTDGRLLESVEGHGVIATRTLHQAREQDYVQVFRVDGVSADQREHALAFAVAQLGKKYDWTMAARFVSRRQAAREQSGKWFCSELVYAACRDAGIELLARVEPWAVSPHLLSLSPRLRVTDY